MLLVSAGSLLAGLAQNGPATGHRAAYHVNGEIHVNELGTPKGKPLTCGHADFKPSWSKTGDVLVFLRRLKDDPVVTNWNAAICVIKQVSSRGGDAEVRAAEMNDGLA